MVIGWIANSSFKLQVVIILVDNAVVGDSVIAAAVDEYIITLAAGHSRVTAAALDSISLAAADDLAAVVAVSDEVKCLLGNFLGIDDLESGIVGKTAINGLCITVSHSYTCDAISLLGGEAGGFVGDGDLLVFGVAEFNDLRAGISTTAESQSQSQSPCLDSTVDEISAALKVELILTGSIVIYLVCSEVSSTGGVDSRLVSTEIDYIIAGTGEDDVITCTRDNGIIALAAVDTDNLRGVADHTEYHIIARRSIDCRAVDTCTDSISLSAADNTIDVIIAEDNRFGRSLLGVDDRCSRIAVSVNRSTISIGNNYLICTVSLRVGNSLGIINDSEFAVSDFALLACGDCTFNDQSAGRFSIACTAFKSQDNGISSNSIVSSIDFATCFES